jgi:cytochrome P450
MRRTIAEVNFDEFRIPSNWYVRIGIHESHRNPDLFANADQFDPDRFLDRSRIHERYAPFGLSSEACLGRQVTMYIGTQFLQSLVPEYRWRTVSDGPAELGAFHWRPASNWRVQQGKIT